MSKAGQRPAVGRAPGSLGALCAGLLRPLLSGRFAGCLSPLTVRSLAARPPSPLAKSVRRHPLQASRRHHRHAALTSGRQDVRQDCSNKASPQLHRQNLDPPAERVRGDVFVYTAYYQM